MSRLAALLFAVTALPCLAVEPPFIAPTDPRTPADERAGFKLPPGFTAQLVASEPDILKPTQIAFDAKGRLWVPTSREYPFPAVGRPGTDKLFVLDDFGPDGKARKITVFRDDLNIPIGVLPLPDCKSVLVSTVDPGPPGSKQPVGCYIWKLTDTKGTGKADKKEKLYGPFGVRDTHGMVNSFTLMPDGWVYACHGFSNQDDVKGKDGHAAPMQSGSVFRFRLDGSHIEVFTHGQVNPFGIAYDPWFNLYNADCHSKPITQLIRGAYYESFGKPHDGLGFGPNMINHDHGSTALCGLTFYDADRFPREYLSTMFLGNVVTNRINFDKIEFVGSTPKAIQNPDFLISEDPWFRPVDIKLGPDGCLYVSDFYNRIIGHYEVPLNHPGRDKTRGRVWRIVWTGKDGKAPPPKAVGDMTKMTPEQLDKLLGHPNIMVRMMATHQLINRPRDGKQQEEARKVEKGNDRYTAHRLWADEAEPLFPDHRPERMQRAHDEADPFVTVHRIRLRTAQAEWARGQTGQRDVIKEVQDLVKPGHPQVDRAIVDGMTADPKPKNLGDLLARLEHVNPQDTHLRHAIRIALRETLRDPAAFTALKGMKLDDRALRDVAGVMLGLPTKDSADYLTAHLPKLAADAGQLPTFVGHAARYGDGTKAIFQFITTDKPDDVRLTVAMFGAYERGLAQKGGVRFDKDDTDFAKGLVVRGLADRDPAVEQSCIDMVTAMKLTASADPIREFALKKGGPIAQRGAAFAALLNLDPVKGGPLLGKVLADADERVEVRERVAQALAQSGTPAAYSELTAALEKAPARLQTGIALAMAGQQAGADHLLQAVAAGKASGRLLQERAIQTKLNESKLPKVAERVAALTKGLPSADARMNQLITQRRAAYGKAKPDPKAGALVFKNNCQNCHTLAGEGAKVGPQLDGIGVRGLDRLLEDVLDPSRNVDQALRATVINLKDGKTLTGLVLREEGELVVMADSQGKEVRIPKADIDERRVSMLSPMPANFNETIKEEDFHNLMSYLLQQRPKDK